MTRDDLHKLIGGYATGSLSEAERKALFEAALEDQDLFDELAREQALKEILEEPGAKQRLIAALASGDTKLAWWRRPLVLSAAGALAVAVIGVSWLLERGPKPVEVARVESPPTAASPTLPVETQPAAPRLLDQPKATVASVRKKASPERAKDQVADAREEKSPAKAEEQASSNIGGVQPAPFVPQSERRSVIGGIIAPGPPVALSAPAAAIPRLAFDYALGDQELVLKFASDGYFSMHFSPGLDTIVDSHVTAGSTRREHIPNNATEADIVFSAAPQSTSGGVSLVREDRAGTVSDPSRTRIELLLRFYP